MLTSSLAFIWTSKMGIPSPKQNLIDIFTQFFRIFRGFLQNIFSKTKQTHPFMPSISIIIQGTQHATIYPKENIP